MFICYITHIIIYHWMIVWFATPLLPSRRPAGIARLQCRSNWKPCMARERRQGMTARDETPQVLFVFWHAVLVLYHVISFIFLTYIYIYVCMYYPFWRCCFVFNMFFPVSYSHAFTPRVCWWSLVQQPIQWFFLDLSSYHWDPILV